MIPFWRRPRAAAERNRCQALVRPPPELREVFREARARLRGVASDKVIWLASFTALGAAEVAMISPRATGLVQVLRGLGLAGAGGLLVTGGRDLRAARDPAAKLDAANDLAWGLQGLAGLSFPAWAEAQVAALGLGLAGASLQLGSGLIRIGRGVRHRDGPSLKLGMLDLGGGLLWLGWDLLGMQQPVYIGSYVVLMIAREAYANRNDLPGLMGRLRGRAQHCGHAAQELIGEAYDDLRSALAIRISRPAIRIPHERG